MKKHILLALVLLMLPSLIYSQTLQNVDEFAPFSEGLMAIRKGNQWGFINQAGDLVIGFRNDIYWNKDADSSKPDISGIRLPMFKEGRCLITKNVEEDVPVFGFIDTKGKVVVEPQFLNVYPYKDGYTTGVLFERTMKGKNEFNLEIYEFKFHDVMMDISGEIVEFFNKRDNIQMTRKRYQMPVIGVKKIADGLVAIHTKDQGWEIRKVNLEN